MNPSPRIGGMLLSSITEKEQQQLRTLDIVKVDAFIPPSAVNRWADRKVLGCEAIACSFVAKELPSKYVLCFNIYCDGIDTKRRISSVNPNPAVTSVPCHEFLYELGLGFDDEIFGYTRMFI